MNPNYSNVRFAESEIEAMSVKERHSICSLCSKHYNIEALIDFYKYFCYHGGAATDEYYIPALTFLYARKRDKASLNKMYRELSFFIMILSDDSKEVTNKLWKIGTKYPDLSIEQIDYLESLYNTSKYCEIMDDILFDKDKLPRQIKGITKLDLKKTNSQFSINLLIETFNCFIYNQQAQNIQDDEYTEYYVYVKGNNNIIKKQYCQVGAGEFVLSGTLDIKTFIEYIESKYGETVSAFFIKKILAIKPWYSDASELLRNYFNWIEWYELTNIAKEYFDNERESIDCLKLDIAFIYLSLLNRAR